MSLVFISRAPLLLVVDQTFLSAYGEDRAERARLFLAVQVLRPVVRVAVSSDATPSSASAAARAAMGRKVPACVVFPGWLEAAARDFSAAAPGVPVAVVRSWAMAQADSAVPRPGRLFFVVSDMEADAFAAGALAGRALPRDSKSSIQVDVSELGRERFAAAFERGLASVRSSVPAVYAVPDRQDFGVPSRPSLFVDAAPDSGLSDEASGPVPYLRFSWCDPRYAPIGVHWLFDDSPYALAPVACAAARKGSDSSAPSRVLRVRAWFPSLF